MNIDLKPCPFCGARGSTNQKETMGAVTSIMGIV